LKGSMPPGPASAKHPSRRFSPSESVTRVRTDCGVRLCDHWWARSIGPHGVTGAVQGELRRVPLEHRCELWHLSDAIGAQPNRRVKLAAPAPVGLDASGGAGLYNYRCEHF